MGHWQRMGICVQHVRMTTTFKYQEGLINILVQLLLLMLRFMLAIYATFCNISVISGQLVLILTIKVQLLVEL